MEASLKRTTRRWNIEEAEMQRPMERARERASKQGGEEGREGESEREGDTKQTNVNVNRQTKLMR